MMNACLDFAVSFGLVELPNALDDRDGLLERLATSFSNVWFFWLAFCYFLFILVNCEVKLSTQLVLDGKVLISC